MGKMALGTVKALSVTCLSELSWHDNARMRLDVRDAGGLIRRPVRREVDAGERRRGLRPPVHDGGRRARQDRS